MIKPGKQVAEGAAYISLQFIASLSSGYIFWIILSRITTTEIIGTFSVIVSLADIFANIAIIGIPDAIERFLAKSFSENKLYDAKVFLKASILFLSLGILGCSIAILIARGLIHEAFRIDFTLVIIVIIVTASSSIFALLNSIVIASLKTKVLPKIVIISSTAKIVLAIILVLIGGGVIGLTVGYILFGQILSSILLCIVVVTIFKLSASKQKEEEKNSVITFKYASKSLLIASAASWIPLLVPTIGTDLGALVLFGSQGSNQAGVYFIALTIYTGITSITYSIFTAGLPALSAMKDGRKRFAWQTIRLSSIISVPISSAFIFYSKEIMQLLGHQYIAGSLSLQVLLLPMLPTAVMMGIDTLVYSTGRYRQSLIIGLGINIPRVILYFILVPIYGSTGAAISYSVGSVTGFVVSILIAERIGMQISWKYLAFILIIPTGLAFTLYYFHVNYILGIITTIIISLLLFLKLRILNSSDVDDVIHILPHNISNPIMSLLRRFDKK
ncbi:MAG: oligosaccharide flippase family protein [Thermoproteota archaeon]|nr:oligosaccharide flippase family protein [Thermoproteota archaeon]